MEACGVWCWLVLVHRAWLLPHQMVTVSRRTAGGDFPTSMPSLRTPSAFRFRSRMLPPSGSSAMFHFFPVDELFIPRLSNKLAAASEPTNNPNERKASSYMHQRCRLTTLSFALGSILRLDHLQYKQSGRFWCAAAAESERRVGRIGHV
jgi:hypothetical protein